MASKQLFTAISKIDAPASEVFRWHEEPGALERLTPPWEPVEIEQRAPGIRDGDRAVLKVGIGPFKIRWALEHRDYIAGRQFRDVQISGPFQSWQHTHLFLPESNDTSVLEDRIEYVLPLGLLGAIFGNWFVQRKLKRLFDYRHRITKEALAARRATPSSTFRDPKTPVNG
ncbi:MAG TPA: SRPBCC family protein [Candidatus Acidoferrales bacterium]